MTAPRWQSAVVALAFALGSVHGFPTDLSGSAPPAETEFVAPLLPGTRPRPSPESAATLVVYNSRSAASAELAAYYVERRGIPASQVVPLECALEEEISRDEYDRTIAEPLRRVMSERDLWTVRKNGGSLLLRNKIRFVVLIHGLPLKIAAVPVYEGDSKEGQPELVAKNEAAVDSELAALGWHTRKISGVLPNPYFRSYTRFLDTSLSPLMLVCRLDAPTPAIVRQMIDGALAAEQTGLWGFAYVDARGMKTGGLAEGDRWMAAAATGLRRFGMPVVLDENEPMYPEDYPARNVALYFGWYSGDVSGPFARPDFRFVKGAVACHIHSFSASSVRNPRGQWVAPLLAQGAAATMGNVYEPYLTLTPNLDIFADRLRNGFTFGEAAYMSVRGVSWMTTFVGDPLYRPFPPIEQTAAENPAAAEWIAYRDGARIWFNDSRAAGEKALRKSGAELRSGVVFEGLGLLQVAASDPAAALISFQQARAFYRGRDDVLRTSIHETAVLITLRRGKDALAFVRKQMRAFSDAHGVAVLKAIETQLDPPPSPAASPKPK